MRIRRERLPRHKGLVLCDLQPIGFAETGWRGGVCRSSVSVRTFQWFRPPRGPRSGRSDCRTGTRYCAHRTLFLFPFLQRDEGPGYSSNECQTQSPNIR
eukprot:3976447-Prymnesium_polylepis.2